MFRGRFALACAFAVSLLVVGGASAHHDEEAVNDGSAKENKHALHDFSHESESEGHIAQNVNYGFEVVGQLAPGGVQDGLYTDVWASGDYAYLGTFQEPDCTRAGVFVTDISDPENPTLAAEIASPPDTRVNDVKTVTLNNKHFQGDVLIHTLEPCGTIPGTGSTKGQGGIALFDVTNPEKPVSLKRNFLDFGVHNTYPWTTDDGSAYLILVDDDHAIDTHIVDITKPQSPKLIASVGLPGWPGAQDSQSEGIGSFAASFLHDVWVKETAGGGHEAVLSYWDAGFIRLDVSDPANPTFIADSTYPDPDPITGFSPPEGNGHAAVYDATGSMIYAGDEDFSPFRTTFRITEGPNAGEYPAVEGAFTKPIAELPDGSMNGSSTYIGLACGGSVPAAEEDGDDLTDELAVIQRGTCTFQLKAETAEAAGYDGFIVFNDEARGDALVLMGGDGIDIPGLFVGHSTGLAIFDAGNVSEIQIGEKGADTAASVVFDGWGYFHGLDSASLAEIGFYAPCEVNDEEFATGFGDLTMHNVEGDPDLAEAGRAYISWYSLGMRAIELDAGFSVSPTACDAEGSSAPTGDYYGENFREVGRFIAEDGSNFWGVHVHEVNGQEYVLGSDRNTGLWIFEFTG